jgi:Flp pilus assembly protein TadD
MDCRHLLWPALGLLAGAAGCQHQQGVTGAAGSQGPPSPVAAVTPGVDVPIRKEPELPKRAPKASTCVAFADFQASEAAAPDQTPLRRQQLHEQARKAYQQALAIDPKCLAAHQGLARLYLAMDDQSHAVAALEKALKVYPKNPALWFELGMAHNRKQQWDPALASLSKAVEFDPENRTYVDMLGYTLARAGRFPESLECFARVHGEARAHYNLARMLQHLGQPELCRQHLELALQQDAKLEPARALLNELQGPAVQPAGYTEPPPAPGAAVPPGPPADAGSSPAPAAGFLPPPLPVTTPSSPPEAAANAPVPGH